MLPDFHSPMEYVTVDHDLHSGQLQDLPRSLTVAQKRQNSMSTYPNNQASKRTPAQPVPISTPINGSAPHDLGTMSLLPQSNPTGSAQLVQISNVPSAAAYSPYRFSMPVARNKPRKSAVPGALVAVQAKTPTLSSYEVPLSPNATQASVNNDSALSGSSPKVDTLGGAVAPAEGELTGEQGQTPHQSGSQSTSGRMPRPMSDEEQQMATKLKETYKNIVNFEEVVQKSCIDLTMKLSQSTQNYQSMYQAPVDAGSNASDKNSINNNNFNNPKSDLSNISGTNVNLTELSNSLWTIYHYNVTLLNNYYDFLVTALKHTANTSQFKTGKNIVDLYKIPRRMWVYGIVGFLEVLKNTIAVFQDHEVFLCFIAYCFSVVSILTDPALEMEGWWCEKLGDLLRMAIALYSSRFIDWKISAEYWYAVAMKTMYGHGKIYYHMSTVQQDNLDALVNIGKSVICRDPFVPTQQYLRLVVENICTQRNILSLLELPIIDFIKIHKVLLSISENNSLQEDFHDTQLQYGISLVTRYGLTFGCDSHGYNFFTRTTHISGTHNNYSSDPFGAPSKHEPDPQFNTLDSDKTTFWLNKGALFAIANVNHLVGFGDPRNPFAKLFLLPDALKGRRDKKERKRKPKQESDDHMGDTASVTGGFDSPFLLAGELSAVDWFYCLTYVNKSVLELSFRVLNHYLVGPRQALSCHVLVWLYFLVSVSEAIKRFPASQNMFQWLLRKSFPWELLVNYLNLLLSVVVLTPRLRNQLCLNLGYSDIIQHFAQNETLPEVWKCWGTLWFDVLAPKADYRDAEAAGVRNDNLFDMPISGTSPSAGQASSNRHMNSINYFSNITSSNNNEDIDRFINIKTNLTTAKGDKGILREELERGENDDDERIVRILLLARLLANSYQFGLVRTAEGFRYSETVYRDTESDSLVSQTTPTMTTELFSFSREVMFSDGRLVQSNFVSDILPENLAPKEKYETLSAEDVDDLWFHIDQKQSDQPHIDSPGGHTDEFNEHDGDPRLLDRTMNDRIINARALNNSVCDTINNAMNDVMDDHDVFHQQQHQQALARQTLRHDSKANFYPSKYAVTHEFLPALVPSDVQLQGDLGDRMDTSLTYITLDTNIWLKHCGRIFKCVRSKAFRALIPLIVFQELRSLRKSAEATISDAATRSVIIIRELYLAREIVPLRFDGTVASDINETTEFENNSSWMSNVDLTMLNVVSEHDQISKRLLKGLHATFNGRPKCVLNSEAAKTFRYCVLITDDRNMRLRAKSTGIISFQSKWLFSQLEAIDESKCVD